MDPRPASTKRVPASEQSEDITEQDSYTCSIREPEPPSPTDQPVLANPQRLDPAQLRSSPAGRRSKKGRDGADRKNPEALPNPDPTTSASESRTIAPDLIAWANTVFGGEDTATAEGVTALLQEASDAARNDFDESSARAWAKDYTFPPEYLENDRRSLEEHDGDFLAMARHRLKTIAPNRLNKGRVTQLRSNNPERTLLERASFRNVGPGTGRTKWPEPTDPLKSYLHSSGPGSQPDVGGHSPRKVSLSHNLRDR
jgi:hypothetical protein